MRIWLPDDDAGICVDTGTESEERITVHQQRFTMTLQPIKEDTGFKKTGDDDE